MAFKDWRKVSEDKRPSNEYVHYAKNDSKTINISLNKNPLNGRWSFTYFPDGSAKGKFHKKDDYFKSKPQAMTYAKNYMRTH